MSINTYLVFDGNARDAVQFYAEAFNIEKPQMMTFGESPQDPNFTLPEEAKDLIMHANMQVGTSKLMFSDTFPGQPFVQGNNITLAYVSNKEEEIRSIFNKFSEGGAVQMPLQETFWSKCYGNVKDRFGIEWQLNLEE